MINVKQAVNSAYKFINNLYDPDELIDLALEEIRLSDDEEYWLVTLGFTRIYSHALEKKTTNPFQKSAGVMGMLSTEHALREYKIIEVNTTTGETNSMKIRTI